MLSNMLIWVLEVLTLKNDPQSYKIWFFFKKTKINELPQIINILKGDISL